MLIVADTAPLNYLVLIGNIGVLTSLFGEIIIPEAVLSELTAEKTPPPVRAWAKSRPDWVLVMSSSPLPDEGDIDLGESEAISLAITLKARLLCDDRAAREIAIKTKVPVVGTLGILVEAHIDSLLDIDEALVALAATNFRRSEGLFETIAEQAKALKLKLGPQ